MSFFNEVITAENLKDVDYKFKIVVLDSFLFMIQGFSKVVSLTSEAISVKISKNKNVSVKGSGFVISSLGRGELVARGEIYGIEFI